MADLFSVPYFRFSLSGVRRHATRKSRATGLPREHFELIYKLSGRSTQTVCGRTFDFLPDDVLLLPRGVGNSAVITEDGETICVFFDLEGETGAFDVEHFHFPPHNAVKPLFQKLLRAAASESRASRFGCDALVGAIFASLVAEKEKQYMSSARYRRIVPAVDYIRAHFRERVSVPELAARCAVSETYLRRLFAHYFGQGPLEFVIGMRLEYAQAMLEAGSATVEEAAAASGFANVGYFSRAYRKRYGVAPGYTRAHAAGQAY